MSTLKLPTTHKVGNKGLLNKASFLITATSIGLFFLGSGPACADNAVKLKVLVISTGTEAVDMGLAYIKPALDEMNVPYDVFNSATQNLTASSLSSAPAGCLAATVGCVGNYNGVILTDSQLGLNFTPAEWDTLHNYETNFHVRESVLSGWPATAWDPNPPYGIYLDYGLVYSAATPAAPFNAQWTIPAAINKQVFEYVNPANPLPITDFAFAAAPRNNGTGPRDGTLPEVVPLLKTPAGDAVLSIINYIPVGKTTPTREVMFSSITNASFLVHSQAIVYGLIDYATQGVFIGSRGHFMAAHLDDLFLPDELWDASLHATNAALTYRLNSGDILNAVNKQTAFRVAHPTAGTDFKLDFPFNGTGAVVNATATPLVANLTENLVQSVIANKTQFRYINHTFSHADMDKVPVPANAPCDYPTLASAALIKAEITKNRTVWGLLGLPEQALNNRILVSGNHSGLKDRKCTDYPELHPEMFNVQSDDVQFTAGANPLFFTAAANAGVDYLASDTSQVNQNFEQYVSSVNDGSNTDRLILPRWPTNVFYNVINPTQLVDEYNYIFHDRFVNAGQDPCVIAGAICQTRTYSEILTAEADAALRHILSFKKWPHFFHQTNVAAYDQAGSTLQFDWLNAVYTAYEKLFKLPVKNLPYYQLGDMTKQRFDAKSATINAKWDRTTKQVLITTNKNLSNLLVTGLKNGTLYGGQLIREVAVKSTGTSTFVVDQALSQ